jgi:hypothetical protein
MTEHCYRLTPHGREITRWLGATGPEYCRAPVDLGVDAEVEPAFPAIAPDDRRPPTMSAAARPAPYWPSAASTYAVPARHRTP